MESGKGYVGERSCVPVTALSVGVTEGAPVPLKVKPGWVSFHSLNVRIGICWKPRHGLFILFHQGNDMITQEDRPIGLIGWRNNISSLS